MTTTNPDDIYEQCGCDIAHLAFGEHSDDCPAREHAEQQRLADERRAANRKPTVRNWVERAHDFDGRALPQPGDVVSCRLLASVGPEGHKYHHYTGTVLWLDAFYQVIETRYRDDDGNVIDISTRRSPRMSLQLADGRTAQLNSHEFEGTWQVLNGDELDAQAAILAQVERMHATADAMSGGRANRDAHNRIVAAADELYATTGLASPERIACFPDRDRGPKRPGFLELLDQDVVWVPARRGPIQLATMGPRHKRNLLAFLRRRAPMMQVRDHWSLIGAPDEVQDAAEREPADEWFERQPLIRKLRELIAADEANELPDEPPPTETELATWREVSGRATDGTEDHMPEEDLWRLRRAEAAS